jgi:carbon-monoxide dehydrogenase small subunit
MDGPGKVSCVPVALQVNGTWQHLAVEPRELLAEVLRDQLGLHGCHIGCETTSCGSCTVLLDGESVKACTVLAVSVDCQHVTTIEGLASGRALHPVQQAFTRHHALQCGFCTPGMVLAAISLLAEGRGQDEAEVRRALKGNLCRCTGYQNIVDAVLAAGASQP